MYCKGCGHPLGDPEVDLHDPDGLSDVAQSMGIQPENEDAHLIVRDGEKGWRYYCADLGQVTSIVEEPPNVTQAKESGEGEGGEPKTEPESSVEPDPNGVYDLPEERDPLSVLRDVITKPFIGLNDEQVDEVRDWAMDYGGQLPPDILQDVLENMSGVQKQTAALARQKYEVKLNRWIQDQSQGERGPPIGVSAQPPPTRTGRGAGGGTGPAGSSASEPGGPPDGGAPPPSPGSSDSPPPEDLVTYRRGRRTKRRNDALDTAAQEAAQQMAQEMTGEFMREFGRYFGLPAKLLEAKIEKDPDWAFEKLEQWDINIDAFLEPSDSRKQELQERHSGHEVDRDVDEALERTKQPREERLEPEREHPEPEDDMSGLFDEEEEEVETAEEEAPNGLFDDEDAIPQRSD